MQYLEFLHLLLLLGLPLPDDAEHLANHRLDSLRERLRKGLPEEEGVQYSFALVVACVNSPRWQSKDKKAQLKFGSAPQVQMLPGLDSGPAPPPPLLLRAANLGSLLREEGAAAGKARRGFGAGKGTKQVAETERAAGGGVMPFVPVFFGAPARSCGWSIGGWALELDGPGHRRMRGLGQVKHGHHMVSWTVGHGGRTCPTQSLLPRTPGNTPAAVAS